MRTYILKSYKSSTHKKTPLSITQKLLFLFDVIFKYCSSVKNTVHKWKARKQPNLLYLRSNAAQKVQAHGTVVPVPRRGELWDQSRSIGPGQVKFCGSRCFPSWGKGEKLTAESELGSAFKDAQWGTFLADNSGSLWARRPNQGWLEKVSRRRISLWSLVQLGACPTDQGGSERPCSFLEAFHAAEHTIDIVV